jgi:transposase
MGARLRVFLTREQDQSLFQLRTAEVPQKVKDRAEIIRLDLLQKCLNCHGSRSETSLRFLATLRFAQNDIHNFLTFARSLLNAHGWYVEKIAAHYNWTAQTVREVLHKWRKLGMEGLWDHPGRGAKTKWKEDDIVFLEECLKQEPRTYNSRQLAQKLERERKVKLSPDRLTLFCYLRRSEF